MNARSPHFDAFILDVPPDDDEDQAAALLQHEEEHTPVDERGQVHALWGGGLRRVHVHVPARVKPRPVLKVVGGIWRADPPLVLAVDIIGPVDPSAEIEILQRHQVVAANLVLRGHIVKLYRGKWGGGKRRRGRQCAVI